MTLVATMLTRRGIAMAADSALTFTADGETRPPVGDATCKIFPLPRLRCVLGAWGDWRVGTNDRQAWTKEFLEKSRAENMVALAKELADELNKHFPQSDGMNARLGYQLAGYERFGTGDVPVFHHIHDGPSGALYARGVLVDPTRFNANYDYPPEIVCHELARGVIWCRNGQFHEYVTVFDAVQRAIQSLPESTGMRPWGTNVLDLARYLRFQVRTISEMFQMSGTTSTIKGSVHSYWILPDRSADDVTIERVHMTTDGEASLPDELDDKDPPGNLSGSSNGTPLAGV